MKHAKKSMFITTILMVAVLIVAVSTATFAWYTASSSATASKAVLTAAESSSANIAVGWSSTATGSSITFGANATEVNPMCPTEALVIDTANPENTTTYGDLEFNTQDLNAYGNFNGDGITTPKETTPWTVSDGAAENAKTSFFVINKNQNAAVNVNMTMVPVDDAANNDKLVVAVFGKKGEETTAKLLGVFCNVADGFVYGTIVNGTAPSTLEVTKSTDAGTPIKNTITLELAQDGTTGSYIEISVKAWLDGTALGQETAGENAAFKFEFNAAS